MNATATIARSYTTTVEAGQFTITEVTGQRDRCGLPAGHSKELAWQQAQEQPLPVRVLHLDGTNQNLGNCWTPQAFERAIYGGYISYGLSMTDGHYAPEKFDAWVKTLRQFPEHVVKVDNDAPANVKAGLTRYLAALEAVGLR